MSIFYFRTRDQSGTWIDDSGYEFPDLTSAMDEAKRLLAEMALDGIPSKSGEGLEVEISNANKISIARLALELTVAYLTP